MHANSSRAKAAAALGALLLLAETRSASARPHEGAVTVLTDDGRTWDELLRDVEGDPASAGRTFRLTVTSRGQRARCDEYELGFDEAATRAFAIDSCEEATSTTPIRVVDRGSLFKMGEIVPEPLSVAVHATLKQSGIAVGEKASAGARVACTVAIAPYLWDGLRGAPVHLSADRFDLQPLDERIHAAPDGWGWVLHGESRMSVTFHYAVVDRKTGKRVLEDVATLACTDAPVSATSSHPLFPETPPAFPPSPREPPSWTPPDAIAPFRPASLDIRLLATGTVLGVADGEVEVGGLQLGVGKFVSEHWYVGASGRGGAYFDPSRGTMTGLVQLAPEARWVFHEVGRGLGAAGDGSSAKYVDWLGFRGGFESIGPGSAQGSFAEISWGSEFRAGKIGFGTVIDVGLGLDPPGGYDATSIVHPYGDFAIRMAFNL